MAEARTFYRCELEGSLASKARDRSALADKIVLLHKSGALPSPFGVGDIRKHFHDGYTENHIRSVMANYCTGTGYWAVEGRTARFKRHSRGKYLCL
jgi:hypothetical protein